MSKKPPDKDFYKCVKVPIKHILKNPDINLTKINNTVVKANKIVIHVLQFMKLYLLNYFNNNNSLPNIDKVFINSCLKIMCKQKKIG